MNVVYIYLGKFMHVLLLSSLRTVVEKEITVFTVNLQTGAFAVTMRFGMPSKRLLANLQSLYCVMTLRHSRVFTLLYAFIHEGKGGWR